jgi:autophagy-related protein 2
VLRVTFVLDFGVPQISIEVDGIQVQIRLVKPESETDKTATHVQPRQTPSDTSDDEEHVPTVDELAKSFLRAEPAEEIRELAHELESRPEYMHESLASSTDSEEEGSAGMGAPLALPSYLRNILNTALDRLSIVVNNIDVEVEDQLPSETPDAANSPASLNFHIERIAIDSLTAQDPRLGVGSSTAPSTPSASLGKRRMHIENICARLVSDAENFVSMSRVSLPSSPAMTRSQVSTSHTGLSETSASKGSVDGTQDVETSPAYEKEIAHMPAAAASTQASVASLRSDIDQSIAISAPELERLASPSRVVDEDRFEDALSDDGQPAEPENDSPFQSRHSLPPSDLGGSSILYDDEGILEYALQQDMFNSRFDDARDEQYQDRDDAQNVQYRDENNTQDVQYQDGDEEENWAASHSQTSHTSVPASEASTSDLPTVSALGRSFRGPNTTASFSQSIRSDHQPLTDNLVAAQDHAAEEDQALEPDVQESPASSPSSDEDLAESQLFTHDEAESMYMSAVGAAQEQSTHQRHVPGGWDSASTSSKSTASDQSGSIPEDMISGSILAPLLEVDEGCETPRPGTPQSTTSLPYRAQVQTPTPPTIPQKQAKVLLTIDQVTVWFCIGLDEQRDKDSAEPSTDASTMDFKPPNLAEDSIFAELPGSFSNYAHVSTHRRKPSLEAFGRKRPASRQLQPEQHTQQAPEEKSASPPSITIDVGSVTGHMDLSTGRIMYAMVSRVLLALGSDSTDQKVANPDATANKDAAGSFDINVTSIGIVWLENLMTDVFFEGRAASRVLSVNPTDAIIRVNLERIRINSQIRANDSRVKLQIGKFVLASLDQDIIAFQASRPRSKRSANTLPEQPSNDVEIDYEQARDKRITVITRPVKVVFDIQKLDDALSSFGGFSGVLELSSSISSANATHSPVITPVRPRSRGVHFGDIPPPVFEVSSVPSATPKVQVQLGDISFTLVGRACAVQLQTTSVRIAMRDGNVRLKVSEAVLSGPYVDQTQTGAPLLVEIKGTTVNFLFAPEETDLTRLISMITPSKDPYENNDDILIDTLLRQRRKGSVLRVEVSSIGVRLADLAEFKTFEALGAELSRLSKVTKYLPDDDRPGLLTLASIQNLDAGVFINEQLGEVSVSLKGASMAHVGVPALLAAEIRKATLSRGDEILVHEVIQLQAQDQLPAIMFRMVGDEMEPMIKAKLFNFCVEYRVSTIMAALGLSEDGTVDDIALGIAASVATITGASPKTLSRQSSQASEASTPTAKPLQVDLLMRNCAIGLNPRKIPSKGLFVLTEAHLSGKQVRGDYSVTLELRKASIHAIDDAARLDEERESPSPAAIAIPNRHLHELRELGFVSLSSISAAKVLVSIVGNGKEKPQTVDVEFKNDLIVIESCADSTQTLIAIIGGLQPPSPPPTTERYRTVVPLQEMMESFTGDALASSEGDDAPEDFMSNADLVEDDVPTNLEFVGSIYNSQSLPTNEDMGDSLLGEDDLGALATPPIVRQRGDRALLESFQEKYEVTEGEKDFDFTENYFGDSDTDQKGKARKWNSTKNQYHLSNEFKVPEAPLKARVRDVNIIWNLYDGYDWPRTRNVISQAVDDVEARAEERRRKAHEDDEDDDFVEEDFLFNSVWIGVPVKEEKGALARAINHEIDDLASETGSYAPSTATRSTGATARPRSATKPKRRLKLERSKYKKMAISLMGVAVDLIVFPSNSGETINSMDVRVRDFEIFDHVPTSTWKKFITCLIEPGAREMNKPMLNLELLTVKPVTDLAASELVVKVSFMPSQ